MEHSLPKIDTDLPSVVVYGSTGLDLFQCGHICLRKGVSLACAQTRGSWDKVTPGLGTLYTLAKSFALWSLSATL